MNKITNICIRLLLFIIFLIGFSSVMIYTIPLAGKETNMDVAVKSFYLMCVPVIVWLTERGCGKFFQYMDQKKGNFKRETDPARWPRPTARTVGQTLRFMSGKVGVFVWDIIMGTVLFSFLFALTVQNADNGTEKLPVLGIVKLLAGMLVIRIFIMLYYYFRSYTKKMMKITESYLGEQDKTYFLSELEKNLKEHLFYYSRQWIITKEFILAYSETDSFFRPVAVPFSQMAHLKYVKKERNVQMRGSSVKVYSAVIECSLKNGKTVDLYVGNRFKCQLIPNVLEYFSISFENTLTKDAYYEPSFGLTEIKAKNPPKLNCIRLDEAKAVLGGLSSEDRRRILSLFESDQKILGIKELRDATGLGLAQAKEIADDYIYFLT